jgi:dienelactone hydrolase
VEERVFRKLLSWLGLLVAVLVLVVAGLTGLSAIVRGSERQLPAPTGPNTVGRIEMALDTGQPDPFAPDGRTRELSVWIWYPASDQAAPSTAPYLPAAWADAANDAFGFPGVFFQDMRTVRTNSVPGAPMLGTPPVVVLMPGLSLAVPDYSALAEELASRGYAVVGINETESSIVGFPDGHVVHATAAGSIDEGLAADVDAWYVDASRIIGVWVDDAAYVTSALEASPPSIGPLDFSRVAYLGHSLGGAASFERCSQDELCVGAVDLDGTLFSEVRHTGLAAPGLVMRAAERAPGEFADRAATDFAHVQDVSSVRILVMEGSTHSNFTDAGLLYGPLYQPLGILGSIDSQRSLAIQRDVVSAFLDEVLAKASPGTLDSTISDYAELEEQ